MVMVLVIEIKLTAKLVHYTILCYVALRPYKRGHEGVASTQCSALARIDSDTIIAFLCVMCSIICNNFFHFTNY